MPDVCCLTCKFGIRLVDEKGKLLYYECRFNPPQSHVLFHSSSFPRIKEDDWCFQWEEDKENES